ncbi:MAG: tRNA (adenosine(37)-N6)-threonylcarbamoyltransferase complex dimerization subunit type 1 TsaB [Acidobacteria bacterium]|nr:tRNA (adenosine(37)-N6)-threonylcarbamoyltransferase complex dimerization subunit type 1 TsaB [Acidobacteriota bacterium]
MWLLSVDTTSKDASVALLCASRLVALVAPVADEQHSVQLFRNIQQALAEAGIALCDLDVYAVASGPGAFTALRVGLTVIKGLAEVHNKPVVPVSVLEAVAESASADGLLVPLVDAYRGQIFAGLYEKKDGELTRRGPEFVLILEDFLARLEVDGVQPGSSTLVSPQMKRWAARLDATPFATSRRESISPVLAEAVARRAEKKLARGETVDALRLEANYVRCSDAELLWKGK